MLLKPLQVKPPSNMFQRMKARFLRSSPKITIYPKPSKGNLGQVNTSASPIRSASPGRISSPNSSRSQSPFVRQPGTPSVRTSNATWICSICSFSNPIASNFDPATATPSTALAPCLACGIKPPFTTVLKAAISSAAGHATSGSTPPHLPAVQSYSDNMNDSRNGDNGQNMVSTKPPVADSAGLSCTRCTFLNHPSLPQCEMCGAPMKQSNKQIRNDFERSDSPAPVFGTADLSSTEASECIKLSFRKGGDKVFHERLKGALVQRKWLLETAPPVPKRPLSSGLQSTPMATNAQDIPSTAAAPTAVGIAGLERRGFETRKNNEVVLGNAFEDLEALMASAKEVVALAESFAADSGMQSSENPPEANDVLSQSAAALGMVTTKDMFGSGGSEALYLSELSRNIAEYLTDDRKGVLQREGGIMSLIDLWAVFNRSRNGVELVSPTDFEKAASLWEKLKLPVRLRRFKSGLLVVQRYDWSDEKTIRQLQSWFDELRFVVPAEQVAWNWHLYGRGVSAQEVAQKFGWSIGVAAEELEMAEDRGILCREEGIEGLRFWRNFLGEDDLLPEANTDTQRSFSMLSL